MRISITTLLALLLSQFCLGQQLDTFYGLFRQHYFNFEDSIQNNKLEIDGNIWAIGRPSKSGFDSAFSPVRALVTDTMNTYPVNADGTVAFKVNPHLMNILVEFTHRFDTDTLKDGGMVEISYDLGNSWNNVCINPYPKDWLLYSFRNENLYDSSQKLFNGMPGFSGKTNGWITSSFHLVWRMKLFGPLDSVMLRFHFVSDSVAENKNGWMIDEVKVSYVEMGGGFDEMNASSLKLFPNPANRSLQFFSNTGAIPNEMKLFTVDGRFIENVMPINSSIDISKLEQGVYFLTFIHEGRTSFTRFIVQH